MAKPTATLTVIRTEWLTPHMVRVFLGDPDFDSFIQNDFTDAYVKLEFGSAEESVLRTYTVRSVDPVAREIALDFVVHGDVGVAGPWAASASAGDTLRLRGPGGAFRPDSSADWYFFAGDDTAIPAISAAVEKLPPSAVGHVIIEVAGPKDEIALDLPASMNLTWIHRGDTADRVGEDAAGDHAPLIAAVREAEWLPGAAQVFIHGEAQAVMHNLRSYVRNERGIPASAASISGYWRRGRTEEGFRVWKSELAASEGAAR